MARTAMVVTTMTGSYDSDGVNITGGFAVVDFTNNMEIVGMTGGEILLFSGASGTPLITIQSVNDPFSRLGNLTKTLTAGDVVIFGPMQTTGFKQTDGNLYVDCDVTGAEYIVLRP